MKLELQIQKNLFKITLIVVMLLQLLLAFQGFDVCDDGFVLTFYQQIFSNPESVEYNFLYWFSGFVGGLWYMLYEDGGILWFRLLGIIVNTLAFYLSYKLLKPYIKQEFLLLALAMVLFVNDYGFLTYYHNHLTALMSVIIIYVLNKAVVKNRILLYMLAGIILSINVFTRIPNLVLFSLVLVVPYAYYLQKESVLKSIKPFLLVGLGSIIGFLMVYATLSLLGQLEIMKNALFTINDLGTTENSSHSFKSVFMAPYYNYRSIAIESLKLVAIVMGLYVLRRIFSNNKILTVLVFVLAVVLFVFWFDTGNIYPIYSLCLIGAVTILFIKKFSNEVKVISFLSFFALITISLGTGGGIKNSGYMGIWIGLPLFFYLIDNLYVMDLHSKYLKINPSSSIPKKSLHLFMYAIIVAFILLKTYNISQQAYFDMGSRFEKHYTINSPLAEGIYTTERRAKIINDLLVNLNQFVEPNDYLMVYDKIPMVHFLTETKPYMYNPWVWIYDYNSFEKKLHKAESEIPVLPIVLQQKFETIYSFSEPISDYMSTQKENTNSHSNERNAIMVAFLNRNNYEIVWSNPYFNIYQSQKVREKTN